MNYKIIGGVLAYQKGKYHRWYAVPDDELARLAYIGLQVNQPTQCAADLPKASGKNYVDGCHCTACKKNNPALANR